MNGDRAIVRAYSSLVALYPRTFRDEYGQDMVQLVRDTCEDEPTWRVASRVVVDLALSIPTQHLERHMERNPSPLIPLIYTAVAVAGVMLAIACGTSIALLVVGLTVAVLAAAMAVIAWRRAAPAGESIQTQHWWKLVLAGPVLVGVVIVAAQAGVEAWFAGLLTVFLGLILTGVGLLLGLMRLTTRRPPAIPT